jgi:hypothetical protein
VSGFSELAEVPESGTSVLHGAEEKSISVLLITASSLSLGMCSEYSFLLEVVSKGSKRKSIWLASLKSFRPVS